MNVLFVCVANSERSVLGEYLLRELAGDRHRARSAGSQPGTAPHPQVVIEWADVVVATCDDAFPVVPGKRYISWQLPDPKDQPLERVRELRDEIAERVHELVDELDRQARLESQPTS